MIVQEPDDEEQFITTVLSLVDGATEVYRPLRVYIVKIDNWFGSKWAWFGGKVLGALGIHAFGRMVIPPFVPNRVVHQNYFIREATTSKFGKAVADALHVTQTSANNFSRFVKGNYSDTVFAWYSGSTKKNGRGSMMLYWVKDGMAFAWHAEFSSQNQWEIGKTTWIPRAELEEILRKGRVQTAMQIPTK